MVLNSAFLHELQAAGLTSAIIHFSKILPQNKIPAEQWNAAMDVIYNRRDVSKGTAGDPLHLFIELFKDIEGTGTVKKEKKQLTLEEQLRTHIIDGEKEGLTTTLETARTKYTPLAIINDAVVGARRDLRNAQLPLCCRLHWQCELVQRHGRG